MEPAFDGRASFDEDYTLQVIVQVRDEYARETGNDAQLSDGREDLPVDTSGLIQEDEPEEQPEVALRKTAEGLQQADDIRGGSVIPIPPNRSPTNTPADHHTLGPDVEAGNNVTQPFATPNQITAKPQQSPTRTEPNTSHLPLTDAHSLVELQFQAAIASSHLSQAELEFRSLQNARVQPSLSPTLSPEEIAKELLKADEAVTDKLVEVEEKRRAVLDLSRQIAELREGRRGGECAQVETQGAQQVTDAQEAEALEVEQRDASTQTEQQVVAEEDDEL